MLFSLDLTGIFFFLFSTMEPKCLLFGRWEAGSDYVIFYRWCGKNLGTIMDGDVDDDFMGIR